MPPATALLRLALLPVLAAAAAPGTALAGGAEGAARARARRWGEHYQGPPRGSLAQSLSPSLVAGPLPPIGPPAPGSTRGGTSQPIWPQQIHMSVTGVPGEAVIEWVSGAPRGSSMVQISDEPGCCDSLHCGCFPYWCWRRNQTGMRKGADPTLGPLIQNVTNYTATDWFGSAMPRDVATGEPAGGVASVGEQRAWMDTAANPAVLNYTLHQVRVASRSISPRWEYNSISPAHPRVRPMGRTCR